MKFKLNLVLITSGSGLILNQQKIEKFFQLHIKRTTNMFVASERFLSHIIKEYRVRPVSTDGGTWYPQACNLLKLKHHLHSFIYKNEKSIIERTMQYLKDRIENFDDYFPCKRNKYKLKHVKQWFNLFVDQYNGRDDIFKLESSI